MKERGGKEEVLKEGKRRTEERKIRGGDVR